jgi:HSP20 family molecular chaperone IbpA
MNCSKCKRRLAREWSYCPFCGLEIKKNSLLDGLDDVFKSVFKNFSRMFSGQQVKGKRVKIRFSDGTQAVAKPRVLKMPKEILEPKVETKRIGDELEISVELPGVKSLNNITLTKLGESLELRAVNNKKGYFKIISVPKESRIINKVLDKETLLVRVK